MQVHTDNSVLSYIQRAQKPSTRQMRWLEALQEYRLTICHIPGRTNTAADALSRVMLADEKIPDDAIHTASLTDVPWNPQAMTFVDVPLAFKALRPFHNAYVTCTTSPLPCIRFCPLTAQDDDWMMDYLRDADLRTVHFVPGTELLREPQQYHHGRLWVGDKIIVPKSRVTEVIALCHDVNPTSHWGVTRTATLVTRRFLVPGLKAQVQRYVRSCPVCQQYKTDHHLPRGYLENLDIPEQRWQSISMDWVTLPPVSHAGQAYNEVLTVTDRATKMVHLIPTRSTVTAEDTAMQFMNENVR